MRVRRTEQRDRLRNRERERERESDKNYGKQVDASDQAFLAPLGLFHSCLITVLIWVNSPLIQFSFSTRV